LYLTRSDYSSVFSSYVHAFSFGGSTIHASTFTYIFIGLVLLLLILSSMNMFRAFQSMKILPRKAFNVFLWTFINSILIYLLIKPASYEILYLLSIPVAYLLAHFFSQLKSKFWGNFYLIALLLLLLLIHIF
jgi:hypothetical protein